MKDDEAKDDESTKKSGKRRKQMARRGLHTNVDKDDSEDSDKVGEQDDSVTGTKTPINPVPVAMKTPSIATYKIIKQGEKGAYQIVREDGTDVVYINFGAMMKSISRDDLTELYRIVMNRYGMDGPEDELEKVFWKCLKTMFEEPLSTDPIWSEVGQQKIISWRYYESCRVHCLNLESMDIYMLIERTYPLSAEMCKAMLDKKLQGGKPDENCYRMLKMMEKQAGIRSSMYRSEVLESRTVMRRIHTWWSTRLKVTKLDYVNVVTDVKTCFASVLPRSKKGRIVDRNQNYVLRSTKERKKRLAMALESSFGQQPPTTPVPPKRISRSVNYDFILPPDFEEVYFSVNESKRHWLGLLKEETMVAKHEENIAITAYFVSQRAQGFTEQRHSS
ncbi:hypothetical protein Tco_1343549 [Tanacetum coccineum]